MTPFEIVAIILAVFLGFGVAMGVLLVSVASRRKAEGHRLDSNTQPLAPPEEDERPPWYDR